IVQEVGGFVVPLLHTHFRDRLDLVKGVVELTKQGVWRSGKVDLAFPVLHCADSELKRLEAKRCGETIVRCLDGLTRASGLSLAGRYATVFGAGWIGRGVADGLRSLDAIPALVDPDPLKVTEARLDGFLSSTTDDWSAISHLCVGASGQTSISAETLMGLPNNAFVASASSRQMEVDVGFLHGLSSEPINDALVAYRLPGGERRILLVNDGYPANFIPGSGSVPDEIVEPILGELMVLMRALTLDSFAPGIHRISKDQERLCAALWLAMRDEDLPQFQGFSVRQAV
ncbi:MAG: S-adenosylhomocysteine hydrolase, partial [Pseudomonadota bacterium]